MSSEVLKNKINIFLEKNNLSVSEFERQAGLKPSAVRNILYGKSKSPTIDTVQVIADELGITVDMLLYGYSVNDSCKSNSINLKLFQNISTKISYELISKDAKVEFTEVIKLISECYSYCIRKGSVDNDFVEWVVEKFLLESYAD